MKKHDASVELYPHVCALARSSLSVAVCLTELIDNGIDAGATRIQIESTQWKSIRVLDNGDGIEDLSALVRFGCHVPHRGRSGSGIYGVGFKDAVLRLAGEASRVAVETVRGGAKKIARIDWAELKSTPSCMEEGWPTPAPNEPSGTTIKIEPIRMRFPDGKDRDALAEQLGYIYSPALKEKRAITIRAGGVTIDLADHRWRLPSFSEKIDEVIEVGAKRARLYAGIVADGEPNTRPGLSYMHGWRVVKAASRAGCGAHSTQRICGFVEVLKGWDRTKNKDDLVNADDLYEEVERRLTPMLEKAERTAHHIEMSGALSALEDALSGLLTEPNRKAKRRRTGKKPGTVLPTDLGPKPAQAENTQPDGKIRQKTAGRRIRLELDDGWKDGEGLGRYEVTSKVMAITLYRDHPWIARAVAPWDAERMFAAAMIVMNLGPTMQADMLNSLQVSSTLARHLAMAGARLDGVDVGGGAPGTVAA